jgi:SAM-dependent methyltransferase
LKKESIWYKRWFNTQDYLDLYKHRDANDAKKIVNLILNHITMDKDSHILDLACGNGRHSILFARKGFNVTGIDLSRFLIKQANARLKNEYLNQSRRLKFEIRDMREIGHRNEFELVVNIFTSFGYFEQNHDNEKVIKSISASLKSGGYFLLDFLNSRNLQKSLVPFNIKKYNNKVIIQIRNIIDKFVIKDILILRNNPNGGAPVSSHYSERIKLYSYEDFVKMFLKFNLRILKVFGDYLGNTYDKNNSGRMILLARKN